MLEADAPIFWPIAYFRYFIGDERLAITVFFPAADRIGLYLVVEVGMAADAKPITRCIADLAIDRFKPVAGGPVLDHTECCIGLVVKEIVYTACDNQVEVKIKNVAF